MDKAQLLIWALGGSVAALGGVIWWSVNRIVKSLDSVDESVQSLIISNNSNQKDIESIKNDSKETKELINRHAEQIEDLKIHIAGCQKRLK